MKPQWLPTDVINHPYLLVCLSKKEFKKALKHLKVKYKATNWVHKGKDATMTAVHKEGVLTTVVCFSLTSKMDKDAVTALAVHESVHVWQEWNEMAAGKYATNELEALFVQLVTQRILGELRRRGVI